MTEWTAGRQVIRGSKDPDESACTLSMMSIVLVLPARASRASNRDRAVRSVSVLSLRE
jgi:hypothetical protein